MKTIEMVQQLVQKDENRKVAIMYVNDGVYMYEDDVVIEDMLHQWEHIVVITKRDKMKTSIF